MARLFFLFFASLLYPAEVVTALDSDRDHPAIVDAKNIEIDFATGRWIYRGDVTIQQGTPIRGSLDRLLEFRYGPPVFSALCFSSLSGRDRDSP